MRRPFKKILDQWNAAKKGRRPVPFDMQGKAEIPDIAGLRGFGDEPDEGFIRDCLESINQEMPEEFPLTKDGKKDYSFLAISGGSSNGAYGAGVLKGWTAHGTRPKFKIVTGVSTGGLLAPPAFLGGEYDHVIEKFYTTVSTKDIFIAKPIRGLFASSVATTAPLMKIIKENYTQEILDAIAVEHNKGRRLYLGTTNLDSQRMVLWNIGKMATSGNGQALDLFHKVLLASASIPILFPPVFFEVEANRERYDEMHVDGSAVSQVFFLYGILEGLQEAAQAEGMLKKDSEAGSYIKRIMHALKGEGFSHDKGLAVNNINLYVIRNGYLESKWKPVKNNIPAIAERSVETMINAQVMGDILRLFFIARAKGNKFKLAYMPESFESKAKEMFDPKDMKRLFDVGYDQASKGYPWMETPPKLDAMSSAKM